jgi:assimilatory nitrate reductase catalytic subunit
VLRKLYPEQPYVEINPADARSLGIAPNSWVIVASQRGQMRALAMLTPSVATGTLFIPMHYAETNRLTDAVFDPYSKQPSYKSCAVRLRLSGSRYQG